MTVRGGEDDEILVITAHLGKNPRRGGSPAKDSRDNTIRRIILKGRSKDILNWPTDCFEIFSINDIIPTVITM
jgi:hypothetical protein